MEKIVQKNLDAYNSLDIETFMSCFHHDIKMYNFGIEKPSAQGLEAVSYTHLTLPTKRIV